MRQSIQCPEPGVYRDVDFIDYARWRAVSNSAVGRILDCPAKYRFAMDEGEDIDSKAEDQHFTFGRLVHTAILEPDKFDGMIAVGPDVKTKNARVWKDFIAENPTRVCMKPQERSGIDAIVGAIQSHPRASDLLYDPNGERELSMAFDLSLPGWDRSMRLKGRMDNYSPLDGYATISDLKTTLSAHPAAFAKSMVRYGYHRQAALYLDGMTILDHAASREEVRRRYVIVAVEKAPPYVTSMFELDAATIELGRREYQACVRTLRQCEDSGLWPGYTTGIDSLRAPDWALDQTFQQETEL